MLREPHTHTLQDRAGKWFDQRNDKQVGTVGEVRQDFIENRSGLFIRFDGESTIGKLNMIVRVDDVKDRINFRICIGVIVCNQ